MGFVYVIVKQLQLQMKIYLTEMFPDKVMNQSFYNTLLCVQLLRKMTVINTLVASDHTFKQLASQFHSTTSIL